MGELPEGLRGCRRIGDVGEHVVLKVEDRVYAMYLIGHFARSDLDGAYRLITTSPGWTRPWVLLSFSEQVTGYDRDLRSLMTDLGWLKDVSAVESIHVSESALDRMIVNTMSVAGRVAGTEAKISAASSLPEALARARAALRSAAI